MFNRCKHSWQETARYWNPPSRWNFEAEWVSSYLMEEILKMRRGWTNVELKCETCGLIQFVEADGKAIS